MSSIYDGRVRITDQSGRVCMDADVESIVSISRASGGRRRRSVLFADGHVAFLENIQLGNVIDMVWPRPDDLAAETGYEQPEADAPPADAAG